MLSVDATPLPHSKRILLVDDEDLLTWCIEMELSALGFEVRSAHSLQAAQDILEHFDPDLIICDQGLPDGGGTEFIRQLKRRVPVIMITAFTPPGRDLLQSIGIKTLLRKPFDLEVLTHAVKDRLKVISVAGSSPFPPAGASWEG